MSDYEHIYYELAEKPLKAKKSLNDYPVYLRGMPNNKYDGHNGTQLKTFGGKFGAASPCTTYTKEQREALEKELKEQGKL